MSLLDRYYPSLVLLILAVAFFTRVWALHLPAEYYFDEVYHAVTAKLVARNDPAAFEWWNPPPEPNTAVDWLHPPLAKYTQAASMLVFGENSFGWRFSSALFGTGVVLLTLLLSIRLFHSKPLSLLVGVLVSSDGLLLSMSRIAMNDIHVTFFILLAALLYTYYRPELVQTIKTTSLKKTSAKAAALRTTTATATSALRKTALSWGWLSITLLAAGAATGSKWSGVFVVGLILLWEAAFAIRELIAQKVSWKSFLARYAATALLCILIPAAVYLGSYSQMFLQGKGWEHFIELHKQIWWYQTHLDATHSYQSQPWQWFLNLRPVWLHVTFLSDELRSDRYAFGNPALFWLGGAAVIGILLRFVMVVLKKTRAILSLQKILRAKSRQLAAQAALKQLRLLATALSQSGLTPILFCLSAYLIVWVPWAVSPRIMFFYHYTPAVPLLAILLGVTIWKFWRGEVFARLPQQLSQAVALVSVFLCISAFVLWFPHWVGIPASTWVKDTIYFALPSWR
jgi:dolichyl-phosphate-mannose-protein mannosyltransferase